MGWDRVFGFWILRVVYLSDEKFIPISITPSCDFRRRYEKLRDDKKLQFKPGHGEVIPLTILHFGPWAVWSLILQPTGG